MSTALSRTLLLVALLAMVNVAVAQTRHLHTYAMQRALPQQVLPALQGLLGAGSSAQAYQNQLILNVTDAEYAAAQQLLQQLDVAARSLLISVRKGVDSQTSDSRYGIDGRIGNGAVQVETGNSHRAQTNIHVEQRQRQQQRDASQQVRAVEGMPAFISAGSAQLLTTQQSPYGSTRELVPIESGFYATARVIDNEVIIDIEQHDDRSQGRRIQTQAIQTQVRGRVGEWIPLGNLDNNEQRNDAGLAMRGSSAQSSRGDIALKVELAP